MKDAYSFHADKASLDETYDEMGKAYERIFEACQLDFIRVEADSGAIGGSHSHEFMVVAGTGESVVVRCGGCGYAANQEKAETALAGPAGAEISEKTEALEDVDTPDQKTVEDVAAFLEVSPSRIVKTLIYETDKGLVAVAVRGDREINDVKLGNFLDVEWLELAGEARVREATGAPVGYAGPIGLGEDIRLIADHSVRNSVNFICGANRADGHHRGVNWGRDASPESWVDLLLVEDGDPCPRCGERLQLSRGIEVGHIFQLGTKYSEPMKCVFSDKEGNSHAMPMGCYGLGIGRTVAAAIEQNHDDKGIIWPLPLAPFEVVVAPLQMDNPEVATTAERIYRQLQEKGVDVLYDDRDERPGVKFKDADLIGFPVRLVVGAKSLAQGGVEVSSRRDGERQSVAVERAVVHVLDLLMVG